MSSEYIKKLENILEGVENYRYDDMSCAEWEELTKYVLKGAIAREKANQEADELAYSVWSRLESREKELPEPKLNENQEIVLVWMKREHFDSYIKSVLSNLYFYVNMTAIGDLENEEIQEMVNAYEELSQEAFAQVMQAFATWALDQC